MNITTTPDIQIIEEQQEEIEIEPLYRVLIHNDHITPMDFVVHILKTIFYLPNEKALNIMMIAHIKGMEYVQTLPQSEAERRITRAHAEANWADYPLHFSMEPE